LFISFLLGWFLYHQDTPIIVENTGVVKINVSYSQVIDTDYGEELERGTGGQDWGWRLTDRGLVGREEGEKRGRGLLGVGDSPEIG